MPVVYFNADKTLSVRKRPAIYIFCSKFYDYQQKLVEVCGAKDSKKLEGMKRTHGRRIHVFVKFTWLGSSRHLFRQINKIAKPRFIMEKQ